MIAQPGVRGPVFAWAARYASLAVGVDVLYRRRFDRPLIDYRGPQAWVEDQEADVVSWSDLNEWADELQDSINDLELGGPVDDDYVLDIELAEELRCSIGALRAALGCVEDRYATAGDQLLIIDIERVVCGGQAWFQA